jgi:serine/threonine protein kinase/WD40 repeat protein
MTDNSTHWQGRMIGRYRLLQKLGQGAMGEVWLAEDSQLRRQVAMKLLPATHANDQHYLQLFTYEARAAAALDHPHILAVHDFGEQPTDDGTVITYLVMPYIGGGTLRHRIHAANGPLPTTEALHYLRQAAQAIDYAHSQRVLHRDIKPANMLLQQQWLWLSDFGIAKLLTSTTHRSQTVSGAGTPEYIAPEQAQGHAEPASDRYSLAIMAYQMLAGQLPFKSDNAYSTMLMQIRNTPPMPRQFNPQMPLAVERVILRGLAKQPAERFASCLEFVQALERAYKGDERPATSDEATALAPWSKRIHSTPLVPLVDAPVMEQRSNFNMTTAPTANQGPLSPYTPPLANMSTFTPPGSNMPPPGPQRIPEYQQPERQQPDTGRRKLLVGGATAAAALVIGGGVLGAAYLTHGSLFATQSQLKPTPTPPGPYNIMAGKALLSLKGHVKTVWDVAWNPMGRYLATASEDTHIMLWDVGSLLQKNTGQVQSLDTPLRNWKFAQPFSISNKICWSADGRFLIVSDDEQNKFYTIDAFKPDSQPQAYTDTTQQDQFSAPSYFGLSSRPHSNTFTVVDYYAPEKIEIGLWKLGSTQAPIRKFTYSINNAQPQQNFINMTAWSSNGLLLAGINTFAQTIIWNGNTGKQVYFLDPPDRTHGKTVDFVLLEEIAWSPVDPYTIATFNLDAVAIWDVRKKQPVLQLSTDDPTALKPPPANELNGMNWFPNVTGIAWSPNGRYVVAGYARSTKLHIWDLQDAHTHTARDGTRLQKFLFPQNQGEFGHKDAIVNVAWSPNGRYIASSSFDTTVIVWQVDKG